MRFRFSPIVILFVILTTVVTGCASLPRASFSEDDQAYAKVEGFTNIRFWGDGLADDPNAVLPSIITPRRRGRITYLALSGGGAGGAFGAGVLTGWTKAGTRPVFDVVSGVSTGALIAPFAFLGSSYDRSLIELYTSGIAKTLARPQPLVGALGNGLWSSTPFEKLVEKYVTTDMLAQIAAEHSKGRRLFVATTNLDAQRTVIWDMGAIAATNNDQAPALFRSILLASASIPGMFPPVMIDVVSNGHRFQEMHSDGGATTQIFTAPEFLLVSSKVKLPLEAKNIDLFIILNNSIDPEFETTKNSTLKIAGRAYSTLLKTHARSAINATYALAQRTGFNFYLAYIDQNVPYSIKDPFNTESMRQLYAIGYQKGSSKNSWHSAPPAANKDM